MKFDSVLLKNQLLVNALVTISQFWVSINP